MTEAQAVLMEEFPVPQAEMPEDFYSDEELFSGETYGDNPRRYSLPLTQQRFNLLTTYYAIGEAGAGWYDVMYQDFLSIFVNESDARMYIKFLAATSPNNGVEDNVHYAMKAYALWIAGGRSGDLIMCYSEGVAAGLPEGMFKGFAGSYCPNIRKAIDDQPLSGPKVSAFAAAMFGDQRAMVIDRWMIRACQLPQKMSGQASVTLRDGFRIKGFAERTAEGVLFSLSNPAEDAIWAPKQLSLFSHRVVDEIRKGETEFLVPWGSIKRPIDTNFAFKEKSLTPAQYEVIAELVTRVADDIGVHPRDFQAGVWTGIKMVEDPKGLDNFVTFYRKHYGSEAPTKEELEEVISRAGFVRPKPPKEAPLLDRVTNPDEKNEVDLILEDAASMLH